MIAAAQLAATTAQRAHALTSNGSGQADQAHDSFLDSMIAAVAASTHSTEAASPNANPGREGAVKSGNSSSALAAESNNQAEKTSNESILDGLKASPEQASSVPPTVAVTGNKQKQGNAATTVGKSSQNAQAGNQTKANVAGSVPVQPAFATPQPIPVQPVIAQPSLKQVNTTTPTMVGMSGGEQSQASALTTAPCESSRSDQPGSQTKDNVASCVSEQWAESGGSYSAPAQPAVVQQASVVADHAVGSRDAGPLAVASNGSTNSQPAPGGPAVATGDGTEGPEAGTKTPEAQSADSSSAAPDSANRNAIAPGNETAPGANAAVRAAAQAAIRDAFESLVSEQTLGKTFNSPIQSAAGKNKPEQVASGQTMQAQDSQTVASHPGSIAGTNGPPKPAANVNAQIPSFPSIAQAMPLTAKGPTTPNADDKSNSSENATTAKSHTDNSAGSAPDNTNPAVQGPGSVGPQPASVAGSAQSTAVSAANASLHATQDGSAHLHAPDSPGADPQGSSGTASRPSQPQDSGLSNAELNPAAAAVNAARLIQRVDNSEIRVGMHSPEFGNVSISTITTHGAISAEISLDHAELAKAIAAHLPETQARLGGVQPVEVRVSTSPQGAAGGGSQQGGTPRDTSGQGSGNGRRPVQEYSRESTIAEPEAVFVSMAAGTPGNGAISSRLDIRV